MSFFMNPIVLYILYEQAILRIIARYFNSIIETKNKFNVKYNLIKTDD